MLECVWKLKVDLLVYFQMALSIVVCIFWTFQQIIMQIVYITSEI